MATTVISLARILDLGVSVAWHEAVAVAQQVGAVADSSGAATGLDNCVLTADGTLQVRGSSQNPFSRDPGAGVLAALLDPDRAPDELRALAARYDAQQGATGDFAGDLAFFARPDADATIAGLAARALAAEATAGAQSVFDRLRAEAAQSRPTPEPRQETPRRTRRYWVAALASIALLAVAGLAMMTRESAPARVAAAAATSALQTATGGIDRLIDAGFTRLGLRPAAEASSSEAVTAIPAVPAVASVPGPAAVVSSEHLGMGAPAPLVRALPAVEGTIRTVEQPASPPVEFFGHDDTAVEPPVLVRPQLPRPLGAAPDVGASHLELLVNEAGFVERVRLRATESSFHERMLVSAAKAWVFRPAERDGQPVKYLLRVPVTR